MARVRGGTPAPDPSTPPPDDVPPLLALLRAADEAPDWRRDRPDPEAEALAARLAAEAADWSRAHILEAEVLLARRRRDAAAAIEALCALARVASPRRRWALGEIAVFADRWLNVEGRLDAASTRALRGRAEAALGALAGALPRERAPHVALARVIEARHGPTAAAEALATAEAGGAPVLDRWLRLLAAALDHGPDEAAFRRAFAVPQESAKGGDHHWAAFRLHRAVACAMAAPVLPFAAGLPASERDIAARMADALALAPSLPARDEIRLLKALAAGRLFRHCPLPEAEAARQTLVAAMRATCARPDLAPEHRRALLVGLSAVLPDGARYWEDAAYRDETSREMIAGAAWLEEPQRSWQRGKFAFAIGDHDLAAEAFAASARMEPAGPGAPTYLDMRRIPAILAARGEAPLLGAGGGTFEMLTGPHDPSRPVAIVVANDLYLRHHAARFARRLAEVAPGSPLHVHLVGDPAACGPDIAGIATAARGLTLSLSSERVTIDAPFYFASARFLRLPDWLDRFRGPIVVTDIDGRWHQDPARFLARRMGDADVGISLSARVRIGRKAGLGYPVNVYPLPLPWTAVTAWPFALAPTDGARRFAGLLAHVMDARLRDAAALPGRGAWFVDQNVLCAAHAHAAAQDRGIRFADLGLPSEMGQA
ncbi:hypothetical protein GWK16_04740 [Roseomonas sp. JC162]|uniref:Uncharacterized protein n=1 Tax=Neoroseomonas marina TaxID=1232220 RepID=A0A848E7X7_9PROT|nr:hypothetical protein [Neoroseomonas marina]NMJ40534.1 hypothetical protein [Neoroseomonas marina]